MTEAEERADLNARLLAVWPDRPRLPDTMPIETMRRYVGRLEDAARDARMRGNLTAKWAADDAMFKGDA